MKNYIMKFGTGAPSANTGLSPTFITFWNVGLGTSAAPPGITEIFSGAGIYSFAYAATLPIAFVVDGATTGLASNRYVTGILDPIQSVDQKVGFDYDSAGTTTGPSTLVGFAKLFQNCFSGDSYFDKVTGIWSNYIRGTSTLLFSKTLQNTSGNVLKNG